MIESAPPSAVGELPLPVRAAGENACPPEDVGGSHAYAEFLEILGDRKHEQPGHGALDRRRIRSQGVRSESVNRDWKGAKARRR
ncbi:MAG: IS1096 element passenger TnpR family protein [Steroidobacteraceae bacterium]